jgi:hypothetical protein
MGLFDDEKFSEIANIFSDDSEGSGGERPRSRQRMSPEVRDRSGNVVTPSQQYTVSRTQLAAEWLIYGVRNKPSTMEAAWWLLERSPTIVLVGSVAVAGADNAFDLGLAQDLAAVQVNHNANILLQLGQTIVHEIGAFAGGE